MEQAEMKGSSGRDGVRMPVLNDFRGWSDKHHFAFGYDMNDGAGAKFYRVNAGAPVGEALQEIVCLLEAIEVIAGRIAENAEGQDNTTAMLGYSVGRFAEQANALACAAMSATFVPPSGAVASPA